MNSQPDKPPLSLAVIGAGPVGLALALQAARSLPQSQVTLFDSRPYDQDVAADARTLALSLGSVQLLQRLGAWPAQAAQPILEVHVSQQPPTLGGLFDEPVVRLSAVDEHVSMLGAVLRYGQLVAPLQSAWFAAAGREPQRLKARFGTHVNAVKAVDGGAEVDAEIAQTFDVAVIAEGGVFTAQPAGTVKTPMREPIRRDYAQAAWVGTVEAPRLKAGVAVERFTRHGPAALLPLKNGQAALVWCVARDDDPVAELNNAQRAIVLNTLFHPDIGAIETVSPLKRFDLGLLAQRTLVDGRTVRIGNAAQTLHPVAGQGLNLGLRDAFELVHGLSRGDTIDAALRRLEWQRAPDRWALIAATDLLARSFTWKFPGAGVARGLGLAALQHLRPAKSALARQMMFGWR